MRGENLTDDLFGLEGRTIRLPREARYLKVMLPDVVGSRKAESRELYARVYFLRRMGIPVYRAGGHKHLVGGQLMSHFALMWRAQQVDHSKQGILLARRLLGFPT